MNFKYTAFDFLVMRKWIGAHPLSATVFQSPSLRGDKLAIFECDFPRSSYEIKPFIEKLPQDFDQWEVVEENVPDFVICERNDLINSTWREHNYHYK
jgi:hypothetical protein